VKTGELQAVTSSRQPLAEKSWPLKINWSASDKDVAGGVQPRCREDGKERADVSRQMV